MRVEKNKKTYSSKTGKSRATRKSEAETETETSSKKSSDRKRKHNEAEVKCPVENSKRFELGNVNYLSAISNNSQYLGHINRSQLSKFQKSVVINYLRNFEVSSVASPFERRVTSIAWHSKYPEISAAGSKGGDLLLHHMRSNHDKNIDDYFIPGVGAGGSILGLKFNEDDPAIIYTASMTGNIYSNNFHKQKSNVLLHMALSWDNWFTCLDIHHDQNLLMSGDCSGYSYLVKTSGEVIWKQKRLHLSKISYCEFNKNDQNIFVTSSIDRTVKLWDLRCVSDDLYRTKPLVQMDFEKGVSSACFSPSNHLNLLVTDHHSQIRVYSSPAWSENFSIVHPHRHFQHMTSIKAVWHPMEDIIIVGRYPDDTLFAGEYRTIDFYDGSDGELLHQIRSPSGNIVSLNAVNSTGDTLLSAAGYHLVYLQDKNIIKGVSVNHGSDSDSESKESKFDTFKKKKTSSDKPKGKIKSKKVSKTKKSI